MSAKIGHGTESLIDETCKECGFPVMVQIHIGTGFCRPSCEHKFKARVARIQDEVEC